MCDPFLGALFLALFMLMGPPEVKLGDHTKFEILYFSFSTLTTGWNLLTGLFGGLGKKLLF